MLSAISTHVSGIAYTVHNINAMNIGQKELLGVQTLALFGGTVFAWSKLIQQFENFYSLYGTFFRFSDVSIPNPLTTACFYGSVAFLFLLFFLVGVFQNHT